MQTFAHYALPAAIAASALGAIVLCIVLMLYGFATAADDEPRFPSRRLFVIRIGHALAVTCFAAVVMLTVIAFLDQRRAAVVPPPTVVAASPLDDADLDARLSALEQRLGAVERRPSSTVEPTMPVARRTPPPAPPVARRPATVRRATLPERPARASSDEVPPLPPRGTGDSPTIGTASGDASPSPVSTPPPSPSLRAKVASDWKIIKRGFRSAGEDIESGFHEFSRRVKRAFTSDDR